MTDRVRWVTGLPCIGKTTFFRTIESCKTFKYVNGDSVALEIERELESKPLELTASDANFIAARRSHLDLHRASSYISKINETRRLLLPCIANITQVASPADTLYVETSPFIFIGSPVAGELILITLSTGEYMRRVAAKLEVEKDQASEICQYFEKLLMLYRTRIPVSREIAFERLSMDLLL